MRIVRNWFGFYVFGNIHVALAVYCLTRITLETYGIRDAGMSEFLFFATIVAYNGIRYVQLGRISDLSTNWIRSNRRALLVLNLVAIGGIMRYALSVGLDELLLLLPFAIATSLYVLPFSSRGKGLRNIPGLKLFLIAFTWAGITFLYPLAARGVNIDGLAGWLFLQRFVFIAAITIPFDIRDLQLDMPELGTLPQVLGVGWSKTVALIFVFVFVLIEGLVSTIDEAPFRAVAVTGFLATIGILKADINQSRYYSSFWVEALPMAWYLLLMLFA